MKAKCKSCPKREDCNGLEEVTIDEQSQMLNFLLQFEKSIGRTIEFTLSGRNAGLQWIFFKIMSNKMRDIAKEIEPYLTEISGSDIDWDKIVSIDELSNNYIDNDDSQDGKQDWFKDDIEEV